MAAALAGSSDDAGAGRRGLHRGLPRARRRPPGRGAGVLPLRARRGPHPSRKADALFDLSVAAAEDGALAEAEASLEEALSLFSALGERDRYLTALGQRASLALRRSDAHVGAGRPEDRPGARPPAGEGLPAPLLDSAEAAPRPRRRRRRRRGRGVRRGPLAVRGMCGASRAPGDSRSRRGAAPRGGLRRRGSREARGGRAPAGRPQRSRAAPGAPRGLGPARPEPGRTGAAGARRSGAVPPRGRGAAREGARAAAGCPAGARRAPRAAGGPVRGRHAARRVARSLPVLLRVRGVGPSAAAGPAGGAASRTRRRRGAVPGALRVRSSRRHGGRRASGRHARHGGRRRRGKCSTPCDGLRPTGSPSSFSERAARGRSSSRGRSIAPRGGPVRSSR